MWISLGAIILSTLLYKIWASHYLSVFPFHHHLLFDSFVPHSLSRSSLNIHKKPPDWSACSYYFFFVQKKRKNIYIYISTDNCLVTSLISFGSFAQISPSSVRKYLTTPAMSHPPIFLIPCFISSFLIVLFRF